MQHFTVRLIVAFATFFVGITAATLPRAFHFNATSSSMAEQEVLDVERQYLESHIRRDTATLDRVLADRFTIGSSSGWITDKARRLALLQNPDFTFESINTDGVQVQVSGDEAMVSGVSVLKARYQDRKMISPPYRFVRSYEKRQGHWQIAYVHITRASEE